MDKIIERIAPEKYKDVIAEMGPVLQKTLLYEAKNIQKVFVEQLIQHNIAVYFDHTISLEELMYKLRTLVINNHAHVQVIANDFDENEGTYGMLSVAAKTFKKQGWSLVDFDADPNLYCLSVVPTASLSSLQLLISEYKLFMQFF